MRYPRLVLLPSSLCAVFLALTGCTGSLMSSKSADLTGPAPTVVSVGEQVNGVAPNRKQEVQFSEAMDPATIDVKSFTVTDSSGKLMPGTVAYDPDFDIASFLPSPALETGASYIATLTTAVASSGGMHLASAYTYTFTTRSYTDTSPISINSVVPAAGATCVNTTTAITITFDEAPDASTVNSTNIGVTGPGGTAIPVTMSINATTTQVVLAPTSPLPSGAITVTVNNVGDLADVMMTAPYSWSFSTACNGGGSGATTQYQAPLYGQGPLFGSNSSAGQVNINSTGNVTVQLKGATANQALTVQFCPLVPLNGASPNCFSIGSLSTDASGDGSLAVMFPKTGPWAGDFQVVNGPVNPEGNNSVYYTGYGPGYISTLQPTKTVDDGILNAGINNAPQAPLTSGTITFSSSPAPNGSLQFVLTGAPPNDYLEAAEGGLFPYDYYGIGGTPMTGSAGDVTFTAAPSGQGGDIFDVSTQNGEAGFEGGFSVPQ